MSIIGPYGYEGGLNTDTSILTLPKGQLSTLQNLIINQGQVFQIPGFNSIGIPNLPNYVSSNYVSLLGANLGGHTYLFSVSPIAGFYVLEDFTGSWSGIHTNGIGFDSFFQTSYCVDSLNSVLTFGLQSSPGITNNSGAAQWSGSGNLVAFPGPSNVGIFKTVNNFLIALGPDGTIYWSAVSDPTTWPSGNSIVFRYGDGDIGTAIGRIGNNAYIFKLNSMGCLQTTSTVIAGAVTLGPLYTVFDKIGTFSMRSVDNLPTGEMVFVGSDYHVYKFDGSTLIDLSCRPYPQSSIQGSITNFINANTNVTANLIGLKVNPLTHSVYLNLGGPYATNTNTNTATYIYDYVNDVWSTQIIVGGWTDMTYLDLQPSLSTFSSVQGFFIGLQTLASSPFNLIQSISSLYTDFNNSSMTTQMNISIPYTAEARNNTPRSAIIPIKSDPSNLFTSYTIGYDGVYGSPVSFSVPTSDLYRLIIPLNFTDKTMSLQIQINGSITKFLSINPIFLDTEIAI